jgi:hypothetical protein
MKKTFSLGLLFVVIFWGCTSNTSSNEPSSPLIYASINGNSVKTFDGMNVATFDIINKVLIISGHLDSTGSKAIAISVDGNVAALKTYYSSNSGISYFIGKGIDSFYTSTGATNEIINLEVFDTIKKIVSGTFSSDVSLAGKTITIRNGSFMNVPLIVY